VYISNLICAKQVGIKGAKNLESNFYQSILAL